jgi:hypothetical protein
MKSIPIVYKATRIMNRNRFEMFTCIKPKIASNVDEALNRSAFFISIYLGFFFAQLPEG